MIVLHPFDSKSKSGKFVIKLLTVGLLMCLLFTGSFGILLQMKYLDISNNLCLLFVDPRHTLFYCRVIAIVLTIIHFVTLITTIGLNINLGDEVKNSKKPLTSSLGKSSNKPMIIQIMVLTISNFLCWIPSDTIYLTTSFLEHYPIEMIYWTTILIIPINALVNPILFTTISRKST